ncbi:MAG: hypothetical protein ABSA57_10615 [Candidatus Acidiferrales bacterium]
MSAQNAPSTAPQDCSPPATQIPAAPPPSGKKVWTNDNLSDLHNDTEISAFGSRAASAKSTKAAAPPPRRSEAWYRDQISRLQAAIAPLDEQIAQLHSAIDGKPTGDAKKSVRPYSIRADDWASELDELSKKRDDISDKISEFRDQARRDRIPASVLP